MTKFPYGDDAPLFERNGLQAMYSDRETGDFDLPLAVPYNVARHGNALLMKNVYGHVSLDAPTAANPKPETFAQILRQSVDEAAAKLKFRPYDRFIKYLANQSPELCSHAASYLSNVFTEMTGKTYRLNPLKSSFHNWNDHELNLAAIDPNKMEEPVIVWDWRGTGGVDELKGVPAASGFPKVGKDGWADKPDEAMRKTLMRKLGVNVRTLDYLGFDDTSNTLGVFGDKDTNGVPQVGVLPAVQAVGAGRTGPLSQLKKQITMPVDMGILVTTMNDMERLASGRTVAVPCYPTLSPQSKRLIEIARDLSGKVGEIPFEVFLEAAKHPDTKITDRDPPRYELSETPIRTLMKAEHFEAVGHRFLPGAIKTLAQYSGIKPSGRAEDYVTRNSTIGPISETLGRAWGLGPQMVVPT